MGKGKSNGQGLSNGEGQGQGEGPSIPSISPVLKEWGEEKRNRV